MVYVVTREGDNYRHEILGVFEDLVVAQTRAIEQCAIEAGPYCSSSKASYHDISIGECELNSCIVKDVKVIFTYTRDERATVIMKEETDEC